MGRVGKGKGKREGRVGQSRQGSKRASEQASTGRNASAGRKHIKYKATSYIYIYIYIEREGRN